MEPIIYVPNSLSLTNIISELRNISDGLVETSLSQYVAYGIKESDALAFLANPEKDISFISSEASLRGITPEEHAKAIKAKADHLRTIVRGIELLRVELISKYDSTTNKLALRDDILNRAKALLG